VDGFNVYRENPSGVREFVGVEASIDVSGEDVAFRFVDPDRRSGIYWLGARGCSGPEGLIGPIAVTASSRPATIAFAATPNPVRGGAARFQLSLASASEVQIDVYDLSGRRIATPQRGRLAAGDHEIAWTLAGGSGRVQPGVYFARLLLPGTTRITRVTVIGD
jgi:hypothetical protein